jgi:hypothetical protein
MPQKVRQGLDIPCFRDEAPLEVSLKHHADVERRLRWRSLSHLLLEQIHVVPGIANLLA